MKRTGLTLALAAALAMLLSVGSAWAARPKVAILPLLVHAKGDTAALATMVLRAFIPAVVSPHLEILSTQETEQDAGSATLEPEAARSAAQMLGAQWVIYGSITQVGRQFSLDMRVINMAKEGDPKAFYRSGTGEAGLKAMASSVGKEIKSLVLGMGRVEAVVVRGNKRIDTEAITVLMKTKTDDFFDPEELDKDIRAIYGMGYFSDVKAYIEPEEDGKRVIVEVKENPAIREVKIEGKKELDKEDILSAFNIPDFTVYNDHSAANAVERVLELYRTEGYLNAEVTSELTDVNEGLATLILHVKPKSKLHITDIKFSGNNRIAAKALRKQMETDDWGIFSFITDAGVLKRDVLDKDVAKIRAYYQDHGFIKVVVGDPLIDPQEKGIVITIPISEGPQYKVGQVSFTGDLVKPEADYFQLMRLKPGAVYSRSQLERDREAIGRVYAQQGYARVRVKIDPKVNDEEKTIDLPFDIAKNQLVYIERISIDGNTRTRDKVIRREIPLVEGALFDVTALQSASMSLRGMGYFETVDFRTRPGTADDKVNLEVKVQEKSTGSFNFGAGYSTDESVMLMANIEEKNLFGRGQSLSIRGQLGFESSRYVVTFVEPWLMDIPLRFSVSLFNTGREYQDYDKYSWGGTIGLGYPLWGVNTRGYLRYEFTSDDIRGVADDASLLLRDMQGVHTTSSMTGTIRRDTRDVYFMPTKGSNNFGTVEFAGLGGSNAFTKYTAGSAWYFPLPHGMTFFANGRIGYVHENSWGDLPLYQKFYLGGINSLRGFKFASVSPRDKATGDLIGGDTMLQFNFEVLFPLIPSAGIKGLVFYDTGDSWLIDDAFNVSDMRSSAGIGFRYYSPIGPIRLEYGWVINGKDGDGSGRFEFSIGTMF